MIVSTLIETLERMEGWFIALGPVGALLMGFVDSIIPLPGGSDFAVITLSAINPSLTPYIVLAAVAGSVTGSTIVYMGARKVGEAALSRVSQSWRDRVENLLGRHDFLTLGVAAMLPPPFPFKVFNLSAGVLKIGVPRFIAAVAIGRLVRFSLEALLGVHYGRGALNLLEDHGFTALGVVAVLGILYLAYRFIKKRREAEAGE